MKNTSAGENKIVYGELCRHNIKSSYIDLANLQKSGKAIKSEIQHLIGFKTY